MAVTDDTSLRRAGRNAMADICAYLQEIGAIALASTPSTQTVSNAGVCTLAFTVRDVAIPFKGYGSRNEGATTYHDLIVDA